MTHFSFVFVVLVISCQSFTNGGWMQDFVSNAARNTASVFKNTIEFVQDTIEESKITENSNKPKHPTIGEALGRIGNRVTGTVKEVIGNIVNGTEDKVEDEVKSTRSESGLAQTDDSITTSKEEEDEVKDEVQSNTSGQTEDSITTLKEEEGDLINKTEAKVEDEVKSNRSERGPAQTGNSITTWVFNALRNIRDFIRHGIIENVLNTIRSGVNGFFQTVRKVGRRVLAK